MSEDYWGFKIISSLLQRLQCGNTILQSFFKGWRDSLLCNVPFRLSVSDLLIIVSQKNLLGPLFELCNRPWLLGSWPGFQFSKDGGGLESTRRDEICFCRSSTFHISWREKLHIGEKRGKTCVLKQSMRLQVCKVEDVATKKWSQNMLASTASDILGPLWSKNLRHLVIRSPWAPVVIQSVSRCQVSLGNLCQNGFSNTNWNSVYLTILALVSCVFFFVYCACAEDTKPWKTEVKVC